MAIWDAFISHAREDKEAVARPLAAMLARRGIRVWLDENELVLGKGLLEQIDHGLSQSDFGIVILSRAFFEGPWTKAELDAILNRSLYREKWMIPIWHEVDHTFIVERSPILASRYAARTVDGLASVAERVLTTVRPHKPVDLPTFRQRQDLAEEFVTRLRGRTWTGQAFETNIGVQTMQQIRALLDVDDSSHLLALLNDTRQEPGLRNRAGSLLFGQRLRSHPEQFRNIAAAMRHYYESNAATDAWQVLRAVALAVADQANDGTLIIDWLSRIRPSDALVEANLAMTDEYYNGRNIAVETYVRRIRDFFRSRPCGRLWEVFYLGRRAVPGDEDICAVLKECHEHSEDRRLKTLCEESITLLTRNPGSKCEGESGRSQK